MVWDAEHFRKSNQMLKIIPHLQKYWSHIAEIKRRDLSLSSYLVLLSGRSQVRAPLLFPRGVTEAPAVKGLSQIHSVDQQQNQE